MLARFRNDEKMEMNQAVMVGKAVFRVRQDFWPKQGKVGNEGVSE